MMNDDAIDAMKVIEKLADEIANKAKQIAYLEVLIVALREQVNPPTEP